MTSLHKLFLVLGLLTIVGCFIIACPEDDEDEECVHIEGVWDFLVIEEYDCDGSVESDPEESGNLHINQVDCGISITGTFRKSLGGGPMTGTIVGSTFSIEYFDDRDDNCTLKINGTVNDEITVITGTWEDDCFDAEDNCYGESGSYTAVID